MTEAVLERKDSIITLDECRMPFGLTHRQAEASRYREMIRQFKAWGALDRPSRKKHRPPSRKGRRVRYGEWYQPIQADTRFILYVVHTVKAVSRRAPLEAELQSIFDRLSDMKKIEDVGDEYTLKPTPRAHSDMKVAIIDARDGMGEAFPLPRLVPDGDGGIVAVWSKGEKRVRLRIRAEKEERDYLYYQSEDEYDVESVTTDNLTKRLEWLLRE
jgi:hypothetical protein